MTADVKPPKQHSETLEKSLRILGLFSEERHGLSLAEISRSIGVNKTSVFRYVNTFCDLGYLVREKKTKLIKIGPVALGLAHVFIQGSDLVAKIKPLVDEVYGEHNLHVDVGFLHGGGIYPVYRIESRDTLAFSHFTTAGGMHYLATGKAVLAFLPDGEAEDLIDGLDLKAKTERTITDKKSLMADLELVKKRGYSINNEEFIPGLIALGAPLFNLHTSRVVGGVSFDASTSRFSLAEFSERYAGVLVELAKKISAVIPQE